MTESIEEFIEEYGETTITLIISSLSLSSLSRMPMQFIWGGVNAIQLISHLPLFEINFPANTIDLFNFLAQIASFDIFPPTERFDFDLSETEAQSQGFELLDYESVNYYDSLGSIVLIFILLVARILIQPLFLGIMNFCCG